MSPEKFARAVALRRLDRNWVAITRTVGAAITQHDRDRITAIIQADTDTRPGDRLPDVVLPGEDRTVIQVVRDRYGVSMPWVPSLEDRA